MIPLYGKTGTVSLELARDFRHPIWAYGMHVESDLQAEEDEQFYKKVRGKSVKETRKAGKQ